MSDKPTSIKIGYTDYATRWVGAEWVMSTNRTGECNYINSEIVIAETDNRSNLQLADTFLHEVIHAIIDHYSRASNEPIQREDAAEWIAAGLVMVWRDNPQAFAWWSGLMN